VSGRTALATESVARRIAALYGVAGAPGDAFGAPSGVVHVASVWRDPEGALESLAINAHTPPSETDAFVLALARARADAIVTTGRILRSESALSHALPGGADGPLAVWRRDVLGKQGPPELHVLTRGEGLDLAHPSLAGGAHIVTGPDAAERLRATLGGARAELEIIGMQDPDLRTLTQQLASGPGGRVVLIEAGASSAAALYRPPGLVDELLLSVYCASALPGEARAGAFVSEPEIEGAGLALVSESAPEAERDRWIFRRYCRRTG
jgi:riboflavin biosynthesis pyrimidine reductase